MAQMLYINTQLPKDNILKQKKSAKMVLVFSNQLAFKVQFAKFFGR